MARLLRLVVRWYRRAYELLLLPHGVNLRDAQATTHMDAAARIVMAFYYVPLVFFVVLLTINAAMHFVYNSLLPALSDSVRVAPSFQVDLLDVDSLRALRTSASLLSLPQVLLQSAQWHAVTEASAWAWHLIVAVMPYATVFMCLVTGTHKVLNAAAEAMVDVYTRHHGFDYPLSRSITHFILVSRARICGLILCTAAVGAATSHLIGPFVKHVWSTRPPNVVVALTTNFAACTALLVVSACWHLAEGDAGAVPDDIPTGSSPTGSTGPTRLLRIVDAWWLSTVRYARYATLGLLALFTVLWTATAGPLAAASYTVECLTALNLPNFLLFIILETTVTVVRWGHNVRWILRHPAWFLVVLAITAPYIAVLYTTAVYFESTDHFESRRPLYLALGLALAILYNRAVDLAREASVSAPFCGGSARWKVVDPPAAVVPAMVLSPSSCVTAVFSSPGASPALPSNLLDASLSESSSPTRGREAEGEADPSFLHRTPAILHRPHAPVTSPVLVGLPAAPQHRATARRFALDLAIAAAVEDAWERGLSVPETLSLTTHVDLRDMTLRHVSGDACKLLRTSAPCLEHTTLPRWRFVLKGVAATSVNLWFFRPRASLIGARYQNARLVLRIVTGGILCFFIGLILALILQESVPALQPVPVRLQCFRSRPFAGATEDCAASANTEQPTSLRGWLTRVPVSCVEEAERVRDVMRRGAWTSSGADISTIEADHVLVRLRLSVDLGARRPTHTTDTAAAPGPYNGTGRWTLERFETWARDGVPMPLEAAGGADLMGPDLGPICEFGVGGSGRGGGSVSTFEAALLALLPYLNSRHDVYAALAFFNAALNSDWTARYAPLRLESVLPAVAPGGNPFAPGPAEVSALDLDGPSRPARRPWRSFIELASARRQKVVVAVRGTDLMSVFDMFQDVDMYVETFVYHALTIMVPGLSAVPSSLAVSLIELAASWWPARSIFPPAAAASDGEEEARDAVATSERHYYDILRRYVRARNFTEPVVLTGHSLGGAIGHIVAAREPRRVCQSFGVHSPGVVLPRHKLQVRLARLNQRAVTMQPSHDLVPLIGWQGGTVFHVECRDPVQERCHAVEAGIHALWQRCPELQARYPRLRGVDLI